MKLRTLATAAVATGAFVVPMTTGEPVAADDCNFPNATVDDYADRVTANTYGITCEEARWIFNNSPTWRARLPYAFKYVVTSVREGCRNCLTGTAPQAGDTAAAIVRWCRVEGYVAATNPWAIPNAIGGVDWAKQWDYDGWQVSNLSYSTSPWSPAGIAIFDGYPVNDAWWIQIGSSPHAQHTNRRWANMSSRIGISFPSIAPAGYTAKTQVFGKYNGDWGSLNHAGSAGCER
jgi:hypothetical protein